jgi:hypothetical protein
MTPRRAQYLIELTYRSTMRAHNRDQASLPAPRPPTRNSGHLPVRP